MKGDRAGSLWLGIAALSATTLSCDNRQAFHSPEPGLERMLTQHRADPYGPSAAFRDGRAMREPPAHAVPRERSFPGDLPVNTGRGRDGYVRSIPIGVTRALLLEGQRHFETVCATCHGILGDGRSVVAEKMELRKPADLNGERVRQLPVGEVFRVITDGYGLMPGYAPVLSVSDRWAIIAYLDALRLSQGADVRTLSPSTLSALAGAAP